jgi:hypothetical protein
VVTEAGSYLRLIDSCVTQFKAQGTSRTCSKSKEEEAAIANEHQVTARMNTAGVIYMGIQNQ